MAINAVISVMLFALTAAPKAPAPEAAGLAKSDLTGAPQPEQPLSQARQHAATTEPAKSHSPIAPAAKNELKRSDQAGVPLDDQAKLQRARHFFAYGDYDKAIVLLEDLVLPGRLSTKQDLIDAQRMLGISAAMKGQDHEARRAFMDLLFLDPDVRLDAFLTPPRAVEFFESVASEMQSKLRELRAQKLQRQQKQQAKIKTQSIVERTIRQRSPWISLVPFGYPQFDRKSWGLGTLLLGLQSLSLGVVAVSAMADASLLDADGFLPRQDLPTHQGLRWANWIAAGSGLLFYALGVSEAWMSFQPEELVSERRVQVPLTKAADSDEDEAKKAPAAKPSGTKPADDAAPHSTKDPGSGSATTAPARPSEQEP